MTEPKVGEGGGSVWQQPVSFGPGKTKNNTFRGSQEGVYHRADSGSETDETSDSGDESWRTLFDIKVPSLGQEGEVINEPHWPKPPSWGSSFLEGLKTAGKVTVGAFVFAMALPVVVLAVVAISAVALSVVAVGTIGLLVAAVPVAALAAYKVASGKSDDQIAEEIAEIGGKYLPTRSMEIDNDGNKIHY